MEQQITDDELRRWLVRSTERLKDMARGPALLDTDFQATAWLRWHDQVIAEMQARGLLPVVLKGHI